MLSSDQITQLRTQAGLSPTPASSGASDILASRKAALGATGAPSPTYGSDVADAAKQGVSQMGSAMSDAQNAKGDVIKGLEAGAKFGAGAIGTAFSPIAPILNNTVGKVVNGIADKISDIPAVQDFAESPAGQGTARVAEDVGNLSTIAGTAMGAWKVPKVASDIGSTIKGALTETPEQVAAKVSAQQAKLEKQAITDTTPAYNKKLIGESPVTTNVDGKPVTAPRVQEAPRGISNVGKSRTVTSTQQEINAGKELAKVPGYETAKTSLDKYNLIEPAITKEAQALESSLKNEGVLRPPNEINKIVKDAVNKASGDSLLLQKADPLVKNYMRVTQRAIAQSDGTLAGELKVRQALDNAYEDAGGKYSNNKGLDQIHRAARNALNEDMEAKATNTEVIASLRKQSNLYRAGDVLQDKARAEGGSQLEQLAKSHPVISKTVEMGVKAAGLGAGLHLLP